ncbi:MAG: hypothetical protein Q8P20_00995 [bacterium]|nr:hypothetical protein [bacterium]
MLSCVAVAGCNLADLKKDPVTQEEITVMEDITTKIQGVIAPIVPVANTFAPGSGIIIGGIVLLLGLVGSTTTAIVKAKRKNTKLESALSVVVAGVNEYSKNEPKIKEMIVSIAGADKDKVETIFNKATKVKSIIQAIATERNVERFLKLFVKTIEAKQNV